MAHLCDFCAYKFLNFCVSKLLEVVMLKPCYSYIRMSVNKIRIYLDVRFSVLIS